MNFEFKDKYNINDLLRIMEILRSPEGCPWDREQNHRSIKKNLIEETYEVVEAINKDDKELLRENWRPAFADSFPFSDGKKGRV